MAVVIPAINVESFDEVVRRIRRAERVAKWVHIDVADGTFTQKAVWHNAADLSTLQTPLKIEIHFMVSRPEEKIVPWLASSIARILFHLEATHKAAGLINRCHEAGKEAGVAIRPDTAWEALKPFAASADVLQTLAVMPGPSGQQFDPHTLEKISRLRTLAPRGLIEVDGGISVGIAQECAKAGADLLAAASSLFDGDIPFEEAFSKLSHDAA